MSDPRTRMAFRLALILMAVGSVALLFSYGMSWANATVPLVAGVDTAARDVAFTGRDLLPAAAVSGWVGAAGLAGVLATRSWGRSVVGVIVALAGLAGGAGAVVFAVTPGSAVDAAASTLVGAPVQVASAATGWWALALLGGALLLYAGAWTAVSGRRWPSMGGRYERRPRTAPAAGAWEVLDRGEDPTDDLVE